MRIAGLSSVRYRPLMEEAWDSQVCTGRSSTSRPFSTVLAISQVEIAEMVASSASSARVMAWRARRDKRSSSVTHQIHACVSRSVGIPVFACSVRVARLAQNAAGKTLDGAALGRVRDDRRNGTAALRHHDGRPRFRHLIEDLQATVLEASGGDPGHMGYIAIAIWP